MSAPWWYGWDGLNTRLFLLVNHAGSGWTWDHLAAWAGVAADHLYYPLWAAASLALAIKRPTLLSQRAVLTLQVAYLFEWVLVGSIKTWLDFARPLRVLGAASVHVIGRPEWFHSFPSGHVAFACAVAASLYAGAHGAVRLLLMVFALWVAWARVAAGAHFPADVVGGALVGLLSSWLASRLLALAGYGARA